MKHKIIQFQNRKYKCPKIAVPNFLALGSGFVEDNFSTDGVVGGGFRVIEAHYIYCALYFYYY